VIGTATSFSDPLTLQPHSGAGPALC